MSKQRQKPIGTVLLIILITAVGIGCARDEGLSQANDCSLTFTPIGITELTRYSSPLPKSSTATVAAYGIVSSVESTTSAQAKSYTVSDNAGTLSATNGDMTLKGPLNYRLYFFSPGSVWNSSSDKTLSIDNGVDFMVSTTLVNVSGVAMKQTVTVPTLTRLCSDVDFTLQCVSGGSIVKKATIGNGGVILSGLTHSPINYTLNSSLSVINVAGLAQDGSVTLAQSSFMVSADQLTSETTVPVLPKAGGDVTITADVILNGASTSQTIKGVIPNITFNPGNRYAFTLKVSDTGLILLLTVTPWGTQDNTTNPGCPGYTLTLGGWSVNTTTPGLGNGSGSLSVGGWTPQPLTSTLGGN